MEHSEIHGSFGLPPAELAPVRPNAVQFSPLIPGSAALEAQKPESLSSMVMLAPPGTIERRYNIAAALCALQPTAFLTVLAPKDKGGSRLAKELEQFGCSVEESARSHHRICVSQPPRERAALQEGLSEGSPRFLEELKLWTQPGVFSWNRIDPGSALLIRLLPQLSGRGADLGCGIGFLSRAILECKRVSHITMVDIDRRAIDCAKKNVDASRASLQWADLRRSDLLLKGLDFVVTNPPFHDGGQEDQELGQEFLRQAAKMLRHGGSCWIVANRHLPYEAVLKPLFAKVSTVSEEGGYKIFEAVK